MNDMEQWPTEPQPFQVQCINCGTVYGFLVDVEGFDRWRRGEEHIQNALPDNTPAEREMMISRTCGPCFDHLFPADEV